MDLATMIFTNTPAANLALTNLGYCSPLLLAGDSEERETGERGGREGERKKKRGTKKGQKTAHVSHAPKKKSRDKCT